MAKTYVLGMDAGLYVGAEGETTPGSMTEMDNTKDVTLNMETGESDVTTRGNSGWRATAATLRECTVETQMVWKPGDAAFDLIKAAWLSSGRVSMAVLSEKADVAGAEGPIGDFSVTNFSRNEPLEEAETVDVTLKLCRFEEWHKVGGS